MLYSQVSFSESQVDSSVNELSDYSTLPTLQDDTLESQNDCNTEVQETSNFRKRQTNFSRTPGKRMKIADSRAEEAFHCMKKLTESVTKHDSFSVYS